MRIGTKMIRKLANEESGYSLVEVIVSIFILAAAILPMVGMLDMGLKSATRGGNYDTARQLANKNLDKVRSLSWADAQTNYKPTNTPSPAGTPVSCTPPSPTVFTCTVTTTYMQDDPLTQTLTQALSTQTPTTVMRVVVQVQWQGGPYTTTGLITR